LSYIFSAQLLGNEETDMNLTKEQIAQATGSSLENAERFRPYLNKYMEKYGINTPNRVLAFLSQIGVESARLQRTEEYASGEQYEGRLTLGNIYAGDGVRFKGRGLIQLTGRSNYEKMSQKVGKDLVSNPILVLEPDLATEVSTIFWRDRVRSGINLNEWADKLDLKKSIQDSSNWNVHENITKAINGGTNGINERAAHLSSGSEIYDQIKKYILGADKKKISLILFFSVITTAVVGLSIYAYIRYKK